MSVTFTENNKRLELSILGYEFPDAEGDYFDANWLNVGIRYDDGQLSFPFLIFPEQIHLLLRLPLMPRDSLR